LVLGPAITAGPNSALWFAETVMVDEPTGPEGIGYYLGEISTMGQVLYFGFPGFPHAFSPWPSNAAIAAGSDGNLWIAGSELNSSVEPATTTWGLLRLTPQAESSNTPVSTFFPIPNNNYGVSAVVAGPDGALWASIAPLNSSAPPALMRMTTSGAISYAPIPPQPTFICLPSYSQTLAFDTAGVLWFDNFGVTTSDAPFGTECFTGSFQPQ